MLGLFAEHRGREGEGKPREKGEEVAGDLILARAGLGRSRASRGSSAPSRGRYSARKKTTEKILLGAPWLFYFLLFESFSILIFCFSYLNNAVIYLIEVPKHFRKL